MEQKEKITTLVNMGFSVDEAIALATGNYRTVPDNKQDPEPKQDPESKQDPEPKQNPEPKQDPDKNTTLEQMFSGLQSSIDKLQQSLIKQNINDDQQPQQLSPTDILSKMLEPEKPGERS